MIVTCPACATRYLVDPAALGAHGRTVRCARCSETWHQEPPPASPLDADEEAEPITAPSMVGGGRKAAPDEPMPSFIGSRQRPGEIHLPAIPQPRRRVNWVAVGWVALAAGVAALLLVLGLFRREVVGLWPATARVYAALGLEVPAGDLGLELRGVNSARSTTDGQPSLVVAGEVANTSSQVRKVPKLKLTLRNAQNQVIKTWDFAANRDQLLPGETTAFQTSIPNPPAEAASALVTFGSE